MLKKLIVNGLVLTSILILPLMTFATENSNIPVIDGNVTIQAQKFNGDEFGAFGGYSDGPVDKYSLRHATLGLTGLIGSRVEYEFRAGSATCLAGGAFTLMDASVLYKPFDHLKFGFKKGEIMRGFSFYEECVEGLTAEKPRFSKTFAPCHPMGAVIEYDQNFSNNAGINLQVAHLGGESQNLDEEYDFNLGLAFRTPIEGLSIGGFYTKIRKNYGPDADFKTVNDPGNRWGLGIDLQRHNISIRSELYHLKGFYNDPSNNTMFEDLTDTTSYIESADLEMNAYFIQAGYSIDTGIEGLPFIQPYVRFQSWDKAANADGEYLYTYYTTGISFFLDEHKNTLLRIDYEESLEHPEAITADAPLLIVRFQSSFQWNPAKN